MRWFSVLCTSFLLTIALILVLTPAKGQAKNKNAKPQIISDINTVLPGDVLFIVKDAAANNVTFKVDQATPVVSAANWNSSDISVLAVQDNKNGIFQVQKTGFTTVTCTFPGQPQPLSLAVRVFEPSKLQIDTSPFHLKEDSAPDAGFFRSYTLNVDVQTLETFTIKEQGEPGKFLPFDYPPGAQNKQQAKPTLEIGDAPSTYIAVADLSGNPLKDKAGIPIVGGYPQFRMLSKQETDQYTKLTVTLGTTKFLIKVNVVKPQVKIDNPTLLLMTSAKIPLSTHVTLVDKRGSVLEERGNSIVWVVDDTTNQNNIVKLYAPVATDMVKDFLLEGLTPGGPVTLTASYKPDPMKPAVASACLKVTVTPPPGLVTGITFDQPPILLVDESRRVRIQFVDGYGKLVDNNAKRALQLQSDPHYLTAYMDPEDPNGRTIAVHAVQQGQATLTITFTDEVNNASKSVNLTINIVTIAGFDRLRVEFHQMDSQTAADAFGKAVANEFYVVQAAINNNLKPRNGDGQGAGVLIYSDTFETYVRMQQRPILRGNNARMAADDWRDITVEDQRENAVNPTGNLYVDIPLYRRVSLLEAGTARNTLNFNNQNKSAHSVPLDEPKPDEEKEYKYDTILKFRVPLTQLYFKRKASMTQGRNDDTFENHTIDGIVYDSRGRAVRAKVTITSLDSRLSKIGENKFQPLERGQFMVRVLLQEEDAASASSLQRKPASSEANTSKPRAETLPMPTDCPKSMDNQTPIPSRPVIEYEGTMYISAEEPDTKRPYLFRYRPYTFDLMNATFEARADRNPVNQTFKALNLFSQVLGFLSGFTRLSRNIDDVAKFNSLYASSFIPALQKLFPTMNEAQRQNLLDRAMRYREEVPYGSQIARVLFFPKGAFTGLLSGQQARIIAINEHNYSVEVAIISSKTNANGGDNPPTGTNAANIPAAGNINQ